MHVYNLVLVENSGSVPNFSYAFVSNTTPDTIRSSFPIQPFDGYTMSSDQYFSWISYGIE